MATGRNPVTPAQRSVGYARGGVRNLCFTSGYMCIQVYANLLLLSANLHLESCFCVQIYYGRLASVSACKPTPGGLFLYANLHLVACFCMQTYTWRLVSECTLTPASLFLYANLHLEVCFCMQIYTWRLGSACKCTLGGLLL